MFKALLAASAALIVAMPASAQTFNISYTTVADPVGGPSITMSATIIATADPFTGPGYGIPQSYVPTSIVGTRGGVAFSNTDPTYFYDNFSEFYFPATTNAVGLTGVSTFLDGGFATLTYNVGGIDYSLSRGNSTFYLEQDSAGTGRQILAGNFSITQATAPGAVPEPASWAMMIAGFALTGAALRTRRRKVAFAA